MENIENMIRAGYGTVDNSEWDEDCKFSDPEIMDMQWLNCPLCQGHFELV